VVPFDGDAVDVVGRALRLAGAREAAEVPNDRGSALGAVPHGFEHAPEARHQPRQAGVVIPPGRGLQCGERAAHGPQVADDEADGVADLVRHAGDELAERRHLLALEQLVSDEAQLAAALRRPMDSMVPDGAGRHGSAALAVYGRSGEAEASGRGTARRVPPRLRGTSCLARSATGEISPQ
jgi:hypothetical protein